MGLIDMAGTTWGRLTVVSRAGVTDNGKATWLCRMAQCGDGSLYGASNKQ